MTHTHTHTPSSVKAKTKTKPNVSCYVSDRTDCFNVFDGSLRLLAFKTKRDKKTVYVFDKRERESKKENKRAALVWFI